MQYFLPTTVATPLHRATLDLLRDTLEAAGKTGVLSILRPLSSDEGLVEFQAYTSVLSVSTKTLVAITHTSDLETSPLTLQISGVGEICVRAFEGDVSVTSPRTEVPGLQFS